jgi:hypothetical protein
LPARAWLAASGFSAVRWNAADSRVSANGTGVSVAEVAAEASSPNR